MKSMSERKTHLINGIFIGVGLMIILDGFLTWFGANYLLGTLVSVLEERGYSIPSSALINLNQITLLCAVMIVLGFVFLLVGVINEATSFFKVK